MKVIQTLIFAASVAFATPTLASDTLWTAEGFDMPESALYDSSRDRIIVSIIGGHPGEADGNGALALLSAQGDILDPAWVEGLDAPKGMAIVGETLLVADLTRLHVIDLVAGKLLQSLNVDGAVFLNDITSDGRQAFISDFMENSLWRYHDGKMTLWLKDEALSHPNGVLLDGNRLLVGSWGQGLNADFTTKTPGSLLAVDLSTQEMSTLAKGVGNIDGIVRVKDTLFVNDWVSGQLFKVTDQGKAVEVGKFAPGLADIAAYKSMLLLPSMLEGTVSAQNYPQTLAKVGAR